VTLIWTAATGSGLPLAFLMRRGLGLFLLTVTTATGPDTGNTGFLGLTSQTMRLLCLLTIRLGHYCGFFSLAIQMTVLKTPTGSFATKTNVTLPTAEHGTAISA